MTLFDRNRKTVFEEAVNPAPRPKRYDVRLLCYASGVVNIGKKKDVFHLTLEQEFDPFSKGYFVRYHRGFEEPFSLLLPYGPKTSEQFNDLKTAWKTFRKEAKQYHLKTVYKAKTGLMKK